MEVRQAEPDEAKKITEELWMPLAREMGEVSDYNELSENAEELSVEHRREKLERENEEQVCLVAEEDGELVGLITAGIMQTPSVFSREEYVKIHDLYVKEEFRREGLATKLFEKVERWAEDKGCEAIELSVDEPNKKALEFYREQGMKEIRKKMRKEL